MFSLLSRRIKIKNIQSAIFVFSVLFTLSFSVFSFADTQGDMSKNIFEDADQDGLSNDEERLYGTNPNNADTDTDGYSDGTEIKSGYDPQKKAPGDKIEAIASAENQSSDSAQNKIAPKKINLTEDVSRQVALMLQESKDNKEELSLDDLRSSIQQAMADKITTDTLPEIDTKSIKIKKQKYSNVSEEERKMKIQEDAMNYVTVVSYILVNNSPVSMQSDNDMRNLASFVTTHSMSVLTGGDPALLDDFSAKGVRIAEQLTAVTVPENMLEVHVKALRLAQYMTTFKENVSSIDKNDPLMQINVLAKAQGFIGLLSGFANDVQAAMSESGLKEVSK